MLCLGILGGLCTALADTITTAITPPYYTDVGGNRGRLPAAEGFLLGRNLSRYPINRWILFRQGSRDKAKRKTSTRWQSAPVFPPHNKEIYPALVIPAAALRRMTRVPLIGL
jgi:hypothetical protein